MNLQEYRSLTKEVTHLKYRNRKVEYKGMTFDSVKEHKRFVELEWMQKTGAISELQRQIVYPIVVNDNLICKYIADFVYRVGTDTIVEDVKSKITKKLSTYIMKKKLMAAVWGITIKEY
jgi:Protein of unknown function (DUF1064)